MRGGLDDALDKLARRDKLRRRAAGQTAGTPPAVTELVEAVAAVVARNPELAITMGVEGAGEPVLLTFALNDGIVQVSADSPLTAHVPDPAPTAPRHADFDLDPVDNLEPAGTYAAAYEAASGNDGYEATPAYDAPHPYRAGPAYDTPPAYQAPTDDDPFIDGYEPPRPTPSPYAATPLPQVPPQTREVRTNTAPPAKQADRPSARQPAAMPIPMPLRVEPEVTEMAAKRLAAMLREDPSLLQPNPHE